MEEAEKKELLERIESLETRVGLLLFGLFGVLLGDILYIFTH